MVVCVARLGCLFVSLFVEVEEVTESTIHAHTLNCGGNNSLRSVYFPLDCPLLAEFGIFTQRLAVHLNGLIFATTREDFADITTDLGLGYLVELLDSKNGRAELALHLLSEVVEFEVVALVALVVALALSGALVVFVHSV